MSTTEITQPSGSIPNHLQQDELTQECRDLISSLPTENGWLSRKMHQYQGFWLGTNALQALLTYQKHFQAQDSDILLVTQPKSGTTWLKAIAFALVNRLRYVDDPQQHPLLTSSPHELVYFIDYNLYARNQVTDLKTFNSPRLFATHLPYVLLPTSVKDSASKIVYLCRNPKDTFVSLWHFTNKMRPVEMGTISLEEAFDKFCKGESAWGPIWDQALGYWKACLENPEKVIFLKYEEMREQPTPHLRRLAQFLGCPFSPEEEANGLVDYIVKLCSFDNLSNLEANKSRILSTGMKAEAFFRRGEIGDWKDHLTVDMVKRIDQITEQKLHGSGLKF